MPIENDVSFPPKLPIDQKTSFEVSGEYSSLIFCHTMARKLTRLPWTEHDVVGRYVLTYEGGETEEIPLTSCGNIGYWNRRQNQPLKHPLYRHNGYTTTYYSDSVWLKNDNGDDVTYYLYEHILPTDKKLLSGRLEQSPEFDAGIIIKNVEAILKK